MSCSFNRSRKKFLRSLKWVKCRMTIKWSKSEKMSDEKENSKTKKLIQSSSQIEKWKTNK